MSRIDLHCHTTASDGVLSPRELVERAHADGVSVIAVTDHDTIDGVDEAMRAGSELDVRVVAGIELSTRHDGRNVHMLGYFVDIASLRLRDALSSIRNDRVERARRIVDRLVELGYEVTMDDVLAHVRGGIVARPHIARALVARGYIERVRDAFTPELIADGGRADVPKQTLTPLEAVLLLREGGAVAVIAHPGVGHHEGPVQAVSVELLTELRDRGLTGIEVDHPDHPPLVRDRLRELAAQLGLIATGGSDFHGDPGHVLGAYTTSAETLAELEARAGG
jgi:3',5'-nucleoside bisphosphate phosphatase